MEITIKGDAKEIAALVAALQERHSVQSVDVSFTGGLKKLGQVFSPQDGSEATGGKE